MDKTSLLLLACVFMAWIAPAAGQTSVDAKPCQFYHIQKSALLQCIEEDDTTYEKNMLQLMWPVMLNGKDCGNLQQELINSLVSRDDIHQLDQAVNYYLYTNVEGLPIDSLSKCSLIDDGSIVDSWRTTITSCVLELKSLNERFATLHLFDYMYFAGAAHGQYADTYLTYDLELNKIVTIQDVVNNLEALRPAILQSIKLNYEFTEDNMFLPEDGLPPIPSCFYVDEGTLHIVYQPYEITGFAQGTIDVPLSIIYPIDENIPEHITSYGKEVIKESLAIGVW